MERGARVLSAVSFGVHNWGLTAAGIALILLVFGVLGYQESERFRREYGRTPWDWPSLLWGVLAFAFTLLTAVVLWCARSTSKRLLLTAGQPGAAATPPSAEAAPATAPAEAAGEVADEEARRSRPIVGPRFEPATGAAPTNGHNGNGNGNGIAGLGPAHAELEVARGQPASAAADGGSSVGGGAGQRDGGPEVGLHSSVVPGAPAPPPTGKPLLPAAAWYADPSGLHELRYWDGSAWTPWVSSGGVTSSDPLGRVEPRRPPGQPRDDLDAAQ